MKKTFILALVLVACSALAGEVKLKISGSGEVSGSGTLINRILENGDKYVRLTLNLQVVGGGKVTVQQESLYDKKRQTKEKVANCDEPRRLFSIYGGDFRY